MKVYALLFLVLMAILAFAQAEDTCSFDGKTLKVGETYHKPGKCLQMKCASKNAVTAIGCPATNASPKCTPIPQDDSKPFPQCCPSFEC